MPMLTTVRIALAGDAGPLTRAHLLGERVHLRRARRARRRRCPARRRRAAAPGGRRSAVCSTARSSVTLMCSPANIASRRSVEPDLVGQREQGAEDRRRRPGSWTGRRAGRRREGQAGRRGRGPRRTSRAGRVLPTAARSVRRAHARGRRRVHGQPIWPLDGLQQLDPRLLELVDALGLEDPSTSSRSIPTSVSWSKKRAGLRRPCPVTWSPRHLAVVGERDQRLLRHRVDRVGDDEVGDVERVGVVRVLHAGGRPERALRVGSGAGERLPAVRRERPPRTPRRRAGRSPPLPCRAARALRRSRSPRDADRSRCRRARRRTTRPSGSSRGRRRWPGLLEAGEVGVHDLLVARGREDQGHVDA